ASLTARQGRFVTGDVTKVHLSEEGTAVVNLILDTEASYRITGVVESLLRSESYRLGIAQSQSSDSWTISAMSQISDLHGNFAFSSLPAGEYRITVRPLESGYTTGNLAEELVTVNDRNPNPHVRL